MVCTFEFVKNKILAPYETHKQLSIREAEALTLDLLLILSTEDIDDYITLKKIYKLFDKQSYSELIAERNINHKCGYPLCSGKPNREKDLYGKTNKILDKLKNPYGYLTNYCSKSHYQCSQFYKAQLPEDALFSRLGDHILGQNIVSLSSPTDIKLLEELITSEEEMRSLADNLSNVHLENTNTGELIDMMNNFKIVENGSPKFYGDLEKDEEGEGSAIELTKIQL
ncbi:related to RNA polymerase II subunit B1 CTD phosphatase RTR1 [Saccharomycodes ludwigii]|uniref:RNA polymerase II subunit B1 CTD phosphatase RPAP2 homolog n=1 Tax=Saccharomycodes ludwigii TaxID=36035 RepID=A0A376BBE7_9ASCO|nr:hypothetical protein SCDLUD_001612 [Saccharomycodes ludwigii]KAH3901829.1 hypothetical protein SCDLUD_001612 [Saccharomycodes ludwigii]SSD62015.1 related to RNA polymerase II subunit B1 CTD phosphatase RTR1 [Saccharomycodes ludwigii]